MLRSCFRGLPLVAVILGRTGSLAVAQTADSAAWTELQPALLSRLAVDQAIRDTFAAQLRATGKVSDTVGLRMRAVDTDNTNWLKPLIARHGWPTPASVGADGVDAAFLLVQHADQDPAFQASVLPQLEAAYRAGALDGQSLALLTDRVAKAQGRPQRYGTQATIRDGRVRIDLIEDSSQVDRRRASLGLPPLAKYQHLLDSVFAKQAAP
jgi:hypothetical protein